MNWIPHHGPGRCVDCLGRSPVPGCCIRNTRHLHECIPSLESWYFRLAAPRSNESRRQEGFTEKWSPSNNLFPTAFDFRLVILRRGCPTCWEQAVHLTNHSRAIMLGITGGCATTASRTPPAQWFLSMLNLAQRSGYLTLLR